jgi:ribosomal protein S26
VAPKQKFVEGDHVRVKDFEPSSLWEVYAVRKMGRKIRYSVKMLETPSITLICNVEGKKLQKVEEK